ncbi:type II toxin-antitoxin system prevent-host-death family antitoxin [Falsiroseomonas tokyonensis]|uniref:Antitoxin n=1 Tax=Falsiroseomonas tokyonensis TaxID=430521 RepID=A0ABV7BTP9_9PROT|nr:type II toxin-antitoxin system prevent-host-death family antitoxin [Falsiroseomonas tokyonensis]MBU8537398.1 type II toxin-antitoxin system Phd/YefM family antitoxin [Falsiroseomonas tokyonensis]
MRMFSSAQAKNHFGELIDAARLAPVAVTKYDRPFVVVMAIEEFERLKLQAVDEKNLPSPTDENLKGSQ